MVGSTHCQVKWLPQGGQFLDILTTSLSERSPRIWDENIQFLPPCSSFHREEWRHWREKLGLVVSNILFSSTTGYSGTMILQETHFSEDGSTSGVLQSFKGCLTKRTFSTRATHASDVCQVDPRSIYSDEPGNGCDAGQVQLLRPSGDWIGAELLSLLCALVFWSLNGLDEIWCNIFDLAFWKVHKPWKKGVDGWRCVVGPRPGAARGF